MKSVSGPNQKEKEESPPSRGAWIEIYKDYSGSGAPESPPSQGAWIEMHIWWSSWQNGLASPPSRGAWIEIKVDGDRL